MEQAAWLAGGNGEIPFELIWGCYRKAFFGPVTLIFELGFGILAFKSSNQRNKSGQTELKKPKFIFFFFKFVAFLDCQKKLKANLVASKAPGVCKRLF